MSKRLFLCFLLLAAAFLPSASANDEAIWSALQSGHYILLIRHAITDPGVGDPPGFKVGDCSTQRNLSEQGRIDARRLGEEFKRRNIPVSQVLSSRWCRCLDTARLAFGRATPAAMLDSMFNDEEKPKEEKVREVHAAAAHLPPGGNLVMVTHNQNIQVLTGVSPRSGEMVVVEPAEQGRFKVIGRVDLFKR